MGARAANRGTSVFFLSFVKVGNTDRRGRGHICAFVSGEKNRVHPSNKLKKRNMGKG